MKLPERNSLAAAFFAVALAFAFQGSRGLWAPDETRYANAAAEMLQSGDYLVSRINHLPFLNKPPLQIWGLAAGLKLLGHNEWGVRAFNACCLLATALALWVLARTWWGGQAGLLAAMIYVSLPGALGGANAVTPDTPLTLWLALALVCFWKSLPEQPRAGPWKALLGLALALGALTKGPAALIPTGAMLLYLLLRGQLLRFFLSPWMLAGAAVFLVPVVGWYSLVIRAIPGAAECFWDSQVWGRLITEKYGRNPGVFNAPLIYGPMLAAGTLPWTLVALVAQAPRLCSQPGTAGPQSKPRCCSRAWWLALRARPVALLLMLWILLPTLFLSLSSSKLPLYILPVFPAVALLCARSVMYFQTSEAQVGSWIFSRRLWLAFTVWGLLLLTAKGVSAYWPHAHDARAQWTAIKPGLPAGAFRLVALGGVDGKGLGFYSGASVVETTSDDPSYLIQEGPLTDQIAAAQHSALPRVFVFKKPPDEKARAAKGRRSPEELLADAGIQFEKRDLPLNLTLLQCRPGRDDEPTARVMLVGDPGGGLIGFNAANALQRMTEDVNLDGIVLLGREFSASRNAAAWEPYNRILSGRVPFYTFSPAYTLPISRPVRWTSAKFGELLEVFLVTREDFAQNAPLPLGASTAHYKTVVFERLPDGNAWAEELERHGITYIFSTEEAATVTLSGGECLQCFKCDPQSLWLLQATEKNFTLKHYDSLGRATKK